MTRTLATFAALAALATAGCGGGGDDEDELAPLREAEGVERVEANPGGHDVTATFRSGSDPRVLEGALAAAPKQVGEVRLRLDGTKVVVVAVGRTRAALGRAVVPAARAAKGAREVRLSGFSGRQQLLVEVDRREQAVPLAKRLLADLEPGGELQAAGITSVDIQLGPREPLVSLSGLGGRGHDALVATVEAMAALEDREATVSTTFGGAQLRVEAESVADAAAAWDEAARALGGDASRARVDLLVELPKGPLLLGGAETSPRRALVLLRSFAAGGVDGFARTDFTLVRATIREPTTNRSTVARAERLVRRVAAAGVRRTIVEWRVADDLGWFGSVEPDARELTRLDDAPDAVLRLLRGVRRAHAEGIPAVQWMGKPSSEEAELTVAEPDFYAELEEQDEPVGLAGPASSRRLARAIRAIDWPGRARFSVGVGPGKGTNCDRTRSLAVLTSSSTGTAGESRTTFGCTDEALVDRFRDTWDDTADR